jgi:excisionase family DNA binding protein
MTSDNPLALRPKEAAQALSISERHLFTLTKAGEIPCLRIGSGSRKTVLYPTESLRNWLASAANPSPEDRRRVAGQDMKPLTPHRPSGS